jgi:hypothetical protein
MLEEIVFIRWNALTGIYDRPVKELTPQVPIAKG